GLHAGALEATHADADELDIVADRVIGIESHVARVVALPRLAELERLDLTAFVPHAGHEVVAARRARGAGGDADSAGDARHVTLLEVLGQRRGFALRDARLRRRDRHGRHSQRRGVGYAAHAVVRSIELDVLN